MGFFFEMLRSSNQTQWYSDVLNCTIYSKGFLRLKILQVDKFAEIVWNSLFELFKSEYRLIGSLLLRLK